MTDDLVARLRSYIPQGDGWNSEFANTLDEAANAIEASRAALIGEVAKGNEMSAEEAYNAWAKPHHEGADWAAFNAGYEAGLREAARECQSYIIERGDSVVACGGIRCRDRIMALLSDPK